jgi:hypothetical protein
VTIIGTSFAAGSSSAFSAADHLPVTLAPGDTTRFVLTYAPAEAGTDTGTLNLTVNACEGPSVELEGHGGAPQYPACLPVQAFSPQQKWSWTGGSAGDAAANVQVSPLVVNLTDTNGDGLINVNDVPDVVFSACKTASCCVNCINPSGFANVDFSGIATLTAVHGDTGDALFAATPQLFAETQLATADLDGDNLPELIGVRHSFHAGTGTDGLYGKYTTGTLLVFDHNGNVEFETDPWTGDPNNLELAGAPAVADLDGDGKPEIIFEQTVFHSNGSKWRDLAASGGWGHGSFPAIADVNGDGHPDIVSGAYVYDGPTGALLWTAPGTGASCTPASVGSCTRGMCDPLTNTCIMENGPSLVVGLRLNGAHTNSPVVALEDSPTSLHLLAGPTGTVVASATWPYPTCNNQDPTCQPVVCPAPVTGADLDGDGQPEFVVSSGDHLYALKYNGTSTLQQLWSYDIQNYMGNCGGSGAAAFDFNGAGRYDVVYYDQSHMYILNGTNGSLLYDTSRATSATFFVTPVIADIDHSGHAAILMTSSGSSFADAGSTTAGVQALSDTGNDWPDTRPIWSDHAWHQCEVANDDVVPISESPVWSSNNDWRAQPALCTP